MCVCVCVCACEGGGGGGGGGSNVCMYVGVFVLNVCTCAYVCMK